MNSPLYMNEMFNMLAQLQPWAMDNKQTTELTDNKPVSLKALTEINSQPETQTYFTSTNLAPIF